MFKKIILNILGPLTLLLLWQILASTGLIDTRFFPDPFAILKRLFELLFQQTSFQQHVLKSTLRLGAALLLSVPVAIFLAIAMQLNRVVHTFLNPVMSLLYPLPKVAIFPLLLLIFGIGDASKIAVLFLGMVFIIFLNMQQGLNRLQKTGYFDLVQIYRIPFLQKIFQICIRGVLPELLSGIKIAIGNGFILIVASEFTIADKGIGVFIWNSWDQFRIIDVYAGIFTLSLLSFISFLLIDILSKKVSVEY